MREDLIICGDVYAALNQLEDNSISVAITSPPYWKQRNYNFDGQIGQENTAEEYIGRLMFLFSKLKKKLKKDGIFFLNVGDKYLSQYGKSNLLQIPYRMVYHMVDDGWHLLDIIIWYKPNHMPSSVRDRFTNSYEPVLVFAKSKDNIYQKLKNVVKIPLQQTAWEHTAAYPERLVEEMLSRVRIDDGNLIVDPFAGTGTTAVVVRNIRENLFPTNIYSIMIEKNQEYINIIKDRSMIKKVSFVEDLLYDWEPVKNIPFPECESNSVMTDQHGEVFIADDSNQFISVLKGMTTNSFTDFHRENAIYFIGVKNWSLSDLCYPYVMTQHGFVLRNMICVSDKKTWYPLFMFAKDSTRVVYEFHLDRLRIKPKGLKSRNWQIENFVGQGSSHEG